MAVIPEELIKVRDIVVANALQGIPLPDDIQLIYDWLTIDGWDDLLGDLESWAINLNYLAHLKFDDQELKYYLEDSEDIESIEITDEKRLNYARELIKYEESENGDVVSINSYKLEREDGKFVYIGCYIETQGQLGAVPKWCGTFKTKEEFITFIRNSGFVFINELDLITDQTILDLWRKN